MNTDHIKSAAKKAEGTIKEVIGKATNNPRLEGEGLADKVEGEAVEVIADTKDALKK